MSHPDRNRPRAVVFGCAGPVLDDAERRFFAASNPLGFILFARNCREPAQVRKLVQDLRGAVRRRDAPVLIDQEGGRVTRLKPPHWRQPPPAAVFGGLHRRAPDQAVAAARINARLIAAELQDLGIDVDCAPVLDVPGPGCHAAIGDRVLADDPATIASLGRAVMQGLLEGGVLPVVKHAPGHGRARADSHLALPVVDASLKELRAVDFRPFMALADAPWAMTAHVLFTAIDGERPGTLSRRVIERVIRGEFGFAGVLVSDDLCMAALSGSPGERAEAALDAGCDLALHCSGDLTEMADVAKRVPVLSEAALERLAAARRQGRKKGRRDFDADHGRAELALLLDGRAA